jgi:hypothetical protein
MISLARDRRPVGRHGVVAASKLSSAGSGDTPAGPGRGDSRRDDRHTGRAGERSEEAGCGPYMATIRRTASAPAGTGHENMGVGKIGLTAFGELLAHPAVQGIPVLIETPGDRASDAKEIALLKELRDAPARKSSPATSTKTARL